MSVLEKLQKETNRKLLLRSFCSVLFIFCVYNLIDILYSILTFERLGGMSIHQFKYPNKLEWLFALFCFWSFFSFGSFCSILLKRIGWFFINAFLFIGIAVSLLQIFSPKNSVGYIFQFVILLLCLLFLNKKTVYVYFKVKSSLAENLVLSLFIALFWCALFMIVDQY
jgi:hypothetical protein